MLRLERDPVANGYWHGEDLVLTGTTKPTSGIKEAIEKITPTQLQAFAQQILNRPIKQFFQ
jgi:predicted Zn-dependent peptidase